MKKYLSFYFDPKVGLRNPSKTYYIISNITCWIFNVIGFVAGICLLLAGLGTIISNPPAILNIPLYIIVIVLILLIFKFLGWAVAFWFSCLAIKMNAYEKYLASDNAPTASVEPSAEHASDNL